jgi:lysozyme family protein
MPDRVLGTIDGDTVRLDEALPIPAGARVELTVRPVAVPKGRRPQVGEMTGPGFTVPDEALDALTDEELEEWGL